MSSDLHPLSDFEKLLRANFPRALEDTTHVIYGLRPDFTLAYVNSTWVEFARANGAGPNFTREWNLGRNVLEAIAPPIRAFFRDQWTDCLTSGRPWEHLYECSSATDLRRFHMTSYPMGQGEGLLMVHSLHEEAPQAQPSCEPSVARYESAEGLIIQCCHCRRTRRAIEPGVWDWVPDWIRDQPPNTSHGLCGLCYEFYYLGPEPLPQFPQPRRSWQE